MNPTKQSPPPKPRRARRTFREVRSGGAAAARCRAAVPREARLPQFVGLIQPAGPALAKLRAVVVGSGSVGGEIVQHLARLQIKEIRIVDPGRFKPPSVATHGIPPAAAGSETTAGKLKARYFGRLCKAISPGTRVRTFVGPLQQLPMPAFDRVDVALLASDNLAAELEAGERCARHGIPLVQASVHGDTLVAQVRFWSNRDGGSCPACAFSDPEWALVSQETAFQCSGPDGNPVATANVMPTMSASFLCSMAADLAMMQVLRHVLGLGQPLEDSVLEYCGFTHRTTVSPLVRNDQCRAEHLTWGKAVLPGRLASRSLGQLADAALGREAPAADLAFVVGDDLAWVESALCCGWPQSVGRFCAPGETVAHCSRCGAALVPQPFHSHRPVAAARLGKHLDRPLRKLGAAAARAVIVYHGQRAVLCQEDYREDEP